MLTACASVAFDSLLYLISVLKILRRAFLAPSSSTMEYSRVNTDDVEMINNPYR